MDIIANASAIGCPIQLSPEFDDKNIAADPSRTNDFNFDPTSSDKTDFKCPMAAHIRKTNPRNDLGSRKIIDQFRILRRGIPYVSSQPPTTISSRTSHPNR